MAKSKAKYVILVTICVLIAIIMCFASLAAYLVSTSKGQQYAKDLIVSNLSETLNTEVRIDSISVSVLKGHFKLYGFAINDRKGVKMLSIDTAEVRIAIPPLFNKEIAISKLAVTGADAVIYKERADSAANYQFVLDSFKSKKKEKSDSTSKGVFKFVPVMDKVAIVRTSVKWDVYSEPPKGQGVFDANHIYISQFNLLGKVEAEDSIVRYAELENFKIKEENSGANLNIGKVEYIYDHNHTDLVRLTVAGLDAGIKEKVIKLKKLNLNAKGEDIAKKQNIDVKVTEFFIHTDNGKPRRNVIKPHRGAFDAGHLDATINADITVNSIRHDTIDAKLTHVDLSDKVGLLNINELTADVTHCKTETAIRNIAIKVANTRLDIPICSIKHDGKDIAIYDTNVTGKVVLQGIALPFAPTLKNFTTPLQFTTTVGGPIDAIRFKNIVVSSYDNRLRITGQGRLDKATKKKELTVDFYNIHMVAKDGIKEVLVRHFSKVVRLKMLRQLKSIGDISFDGRFGVQFMRVDMKGVLHCKYTDLNFDFYIDGYKKKLHGNAMTESIDLGAIMGIKKLYVGRSEASFIINTGKKTPEGLYANRRHGRLPIGTMHAVIEKAKYGILKVKKITADINSDGVVAKGSLEAIHSLIDFNMDFEYKQTDEEQSLKTKDKVRIHKREKSGKKEKKKKKKDS